MKHLATIGVFAIILVSIYIMSPDLGLGWRKPVGLLVLMVGIEGADYSRKRWPPS